MPLRIIIGRAGSGKTRRCLEEIRRALLADPRGAPLYYIIPEQATFQAEYALATLPGIKGSIRAQALSFHRLAYQAAQEVGGAQGVFIDDTGKTMVLRKVLESLRPKLKVFAFKGGHTGAVESLVDLYNELRRSRVDPTRLEGLFSPPAPSPKQQQKGYSTHLQDKVRDLSLIFGEMSRALAGEYLDAEDYLDLLIEKAPASQKLKQAEIWVDGFNSFNNQEGAVLAAFLQHCRHVTVTLCLDAEPPAAGLPADLDPFYPTSLACRRLLQAAVTLKTPYRVETLPANPVRRFWQNPPLAHLEEELHHQPIRPWPQAEGVQKSLRLTAAPHRRAEVETMAREMIRLAREEGCRWREMAVLTGGLEDYRDVLATVLHDFDIPFFLDRKRTLLHHPLVEFLRSALEVVQRNWPWDAVFRCAKTDLLLPPLSAGEEREAWRERVNRLENYVLAFGISGARWHQEEPWDYRKRDGLEEEESPPVSREEEKYLKEINDTRNILRAPLIRFQERLRQAATVKEKAEAIYLLLEDAGAPRHLETWREEALSRGDVEQVREHGQGYKLILDLLDQMVEIMGAEKMGNPLLARVLEAGLEGLRLSLVPPALDQVLVGTPDRTRAGNVKCLFVLGATDGSFPVRLQEDSLLTDEERETLNELGIDLTPLGEKQLREEEFLVYRTLTLPSRQLWVSYPLADPEGQGLLPSLVISRLRALFPSLPEETPAVEPSPALPDHELLSYIAHPRRTLSHLAVQLGTVKKQAGSADPAAPSAPTAPALNPLWWDVYNWYAREKAWRERASSLLKGVFYENRERPLTAGTCRSLYGSTLRLSTSRLEKYRSCPFSQFASHGLKLKERDVYRLDSPQIGLFFHTALYRLARTLQERGQTFKDLSEEETLKLVEEEVDGLLPRLQKQILLSSNRYRFVGKRLLGTVGQTALALREQALRSSFQPVGLEVAFGEEEGLPALTFYLEGGIQVQLVGRIDRLDGARGSDGRYYLRVVDYKSGRTSLDLCQVYYGLSLQIIAYLEVALQTAAEWLGEEAFPAGILYFRVHSPVLREKGPLPPEEARNKLLQAYKMQGKVLHQLEIVRLMDTGLTRGTSAVIPVGLTAGGDFHKRSSLVKWGEFDTLRSHVERTIRESAAAIMAGDIQISPYSLEDRRPCTFCPYKAVCQFDPQVQGNSYRCLPRLEEGEVFSRLGRLQKGEGEKFGEGKDDKAAESKDYGRVDKTDCRREEGDQK